MMAVGFKIGFAVILEVDRGDADPADYGIENFVAIRKTMCTDPHPAFVFNVHSYECLKGFEVAEIMSHLLGNDLGPVCPCRGLPRARSSAGSRAHRD